jgi:Protein of unknown function DUF262
MKTGTATVRKLMDQVTHGELRLPEIQRGYVWKQAQVAGLVDSLYREYPSGSILLWETADAVTEKHLQSAATGVSLIKPLYLLDGQQRLTSLHRVFTGHERAQVVFDVLTEKFQIESATTKKDPRWIRVHELLAEKVSAFRARLATTTERGDLRHFRRGVVRTARPHPEGRQVHVLAGDPRRSPV